MALDIPGKDVSIALSEKIRQKVKLLEEKGITPTLRTIRAGDNPGDLSYERGAAKRCAALGIAVQNLAFPADVSREELYAAVCEANEDPSVHGVLMFRPLPARLNQDEIGNALLPQKDVDGMTDLSMNGPVHERGLYRERGRLSAVHGAGLHGDPRLLRDRSEREKSSSDRAFQRDRKTCLHAASQKACYGYGLPYQNQGSCRGSAQGGYSGGCRGKTEDDRGGLCASGTGDPGRWNQCG